jgi:hypothetical protein
MSPRLADLVDKLETAAQEAETNLSLALSDRLPTELEAAVFEAMKKEIVGNFIPKVKKMVENFEVEELSRRLPEKVAAMEKKATDLDNIIDSLVDLSLHNKSALDALAFEITNSHFQDIINEAVAPFEKKSLRALINSGSFIDAFELAANDATALEEFLASETPDAWIEKVDHVPHLKQRMTLAVARALVEDPNLPPLEQLADRVEWLMELVISLKNRDERNTEFLDSLGDLLSSVNLARMDRRIATKVSQILRLVRSLQW